MQFWTELSFCSLLVICANIVTGQNDQNCRHVRNHCGELYQNFTSGSPFYRDLRTPKLIEKLGYPVEVHEIKTEDSYILTVFRIPYSQKSKPAANKVPVFCMHGFLQSSAQWFVQDANKALVFMLADAGYDVWIGNARGTSYSQKHVHLFSDDPHDLRYWNFSAHEYGKYDIPAVINYITEYTQEPSLYYIGHSLGAEQFFIAMILNPKLNIKIRTMFAMAPGAYLGNTASPAFLLSPLLANYPISRLGNRLGKGRFPPKCVKNMIESISRVCRTAIILCNICTSVQYYWIGYDLCQPDLISLIGPLAHFDLTSVKTFSHASQHVAAGSFRQYDYGLTQNLQNYGKKTPPDYDWENLKVPVIVYYSEEDKTVVPKDIIRTATALGTNLKELRKVSSPGFNHMDFIISKDAYKYVYSSIIQIMNSQKPHG